MSSGKWSPSCLGLNVLTIATLSGHDTFTSTDESWVHKICMVYLPVNDIIEKGFILRN